MKIKTLLLFLLLFHLKSISQENPISKNDIQNVYKNLAKESITRSNSLSINLSDLAFKVPTNDNYLPHLKVIFKQNSGSLSKTINEYRFLFDFSNTFGYKKGDLYNRKINYKNLIQNQDLKNVTHIEISLELIKSRNASDDLKNLISSVLGISINSENSPFGVSLIDKIISSSKKDGLTNLLFQNEFEIPSNFDEYNNLKKSDRNTPYISSNDKIGIILDSSIEDNSGTLIGGISNIINSLSKFTYGKKIIEKPIVDFNGVLSLSFTKNRSKVLPKVVKEKIRNLVEKIDNLDPSQIPTTKEGINDYISRNYTSLEEKLNLLREADGITETQNKHLGLIVNLAKVYFRKFVYNNAKSPSVITSAHFFNSYNLFKKKCRRTTNYTQVKYINDIYTKENSSMNKQKNDEILSELFLFPSLSDEINQASMDWQIYLDEYINSKL
ncbi:MAG: hypothetical protein N4A45_08705 [Flavobacteriales bacterium]|jgi:hypothetical protein|nr:hypothetical protein [Flavobacteriales bacterium]